MDDDSRQKLVSELEKVLKAHEDETGETLTLSIIITNQVRTKTLAETWHQRFSWDGEKLVSDPLGTSF